MSVSETLSMTRPAQWLRSARFDMSFIVGTWMVGVTAAVIAILEPKLLWPLILIDLWVLGYHHVVSTYTRLCFDKESFAQSKFLIFGLFPIVASATALVGGIVGLWAIFTIYFHWQWFHYVRQSWGVSRAYRGKDREASYEEGRLDQTIFWGVPVLGLIWRSNQQPEKFLGTDIALVPMPDWTVTVAAGAVMGLLC
ncbi:MAG: hypothetical protein KAH44_21750, partial [Oricola sp.]|nr:hypothetical protein [Oricola sp.]